MITVAACLLLLGLDPACSLTNAELLSGIGPWLPQMGNCQVAFESGNKVATYAGAKFEPTLFPFGSLTKSATATVVLKLAELKKLNLNDPLSKFGFQVPNAATTTVEQLLCHVSGYPEYFWDADPAKTPSSSDIWALVNKACSSSPIQGGKFKYSNTNYFLLGQICEKVTGKPLDELYRKYLDEPLGLTMKCGRTDKFDPRWYGGAGELMGTIDDLAGWAGAIARNDSRVLKHSSWHDMLSPHISIDGKPDSTQQYGYGVIMSPLSIYDSASHAGEVPENALVPPFVSLMIVRPDADNPVGYAALTRAAWSKESLNAAYGAYATLTAFSDAKKWMNRLRNRPDPEQLLKWVSSGQMSADFAKDIDLPTLSQLPTLTGATSFTVLGDVVSGSSVALVLSLKRGLVADTISVQFGAKGRLDGFTYHMGSTK